MALVLVPRPGHARRHGKEAAADRRFDRPLGMDSATVERKGRKTQADESKPAVNSLMARITAMSESIFREDPLKTIDDMDRRFKLIAGLVVLGLSACSTSHIMVGRARPPISPDQVQIYLHPPATKYEEIAVLDSSSRNSFTFTAQGKTDVVITRLKEEAAKLGANGILLQGVGDQAAGSVGSGFANGTASGNSATAVGLGISGTIFVKSGTGLAIYVEPN